jgi:hypothetical protein
MFKYLAKYEEVVSHTYHFCNFSILNFLTYEENLIFFLSVQFLVIHPYIRLQVAQQGERRVRELQPGGR